MALNLKKIVVEYLKNNPDIKYSARDIAQYIFDNFRDDCEEKRRNSKATILPLNTDAALIQQLVREIGSQRPQIQKMISSIKVTDERPRKYYFSTKSDIEEVGEADHSTELLENIKVTEHSLYPILTEYLKSEFNLKSKRIDEKRSSNSHGTRGNHWLFPDIVAMENLSSEWHAEIKNAAKHNSDRWAKLWSFEVKILINKSNVRESFFQAVSNSSWANYAYLVASEIGDSTLKELRILNGLHGVGFIKLDVENPSESSIVIPARENIDVDWNTANRLAVENSDFVTFVKSIRQFYQIGETKDTDWD